MKFYQLSLAIFVTILTSANGQLPDQTPCYSDAQCASFCCSNNKDYKVKGICELASENQRCANRKATGLKILISFYAILVPLLGLCAYVKIK